MKSLFPIFLLLLSIYAAPDKVAFVKKVTDLLRSEKANTKGELNRVGCYAVLCHFEDKNGCQVQCRKLATLINQPDADGFVDIPLDDEPVLRIADEPKNEEECSEKCVSLTYAKNEARKVCSSLCRTVFSYSNWRKYTKEARDATRKAFKQFKTHVH